jgi:hypothetical protein
MIGTRLRATRRAITAQHAAPDNTSKTLATSAQPSGNLVRLGGAAAGGRGTSRGSERSGSERGDGAGGSVTERASECMTRRDGASAESGAGVGTRRRACSGGATSTGRDESTGKGRPAVTGVRGRAWPATSSGTVRATIVCSSCGRGRTTRVRPSTATGKTVSNRGAAVGAAATAARGAGAGAGGASAGGSGATAGGAATAGLDAGTGVGAGSGGGAGTGTGDARVLLGGSSVSGST